MEQPKEDTLRIEWKNRVGFVDRESWDRLARPMKTPFLEWNWLNLMERSGSIAPETGWFPNHLTVWNGTRLVAAAPLYIKTHSEGEFVYDYAWAQAAARIGVKYYPKMVGMSPVTPLAGYRFLVDPEIDEAKVTGTMAREIDRFCIEHGFSGCNFLFVDPSWRQIMEPLGRHGWAHQSFTWKNLDFQSFDDYLFQFKTNQRRNIRRERNSLEKQGLILKTYFEDEIPEEYFGRMYDFYENTNDKFGPWGCKYLTKNFFECLYDSFRRGLLLVVAYEKAKPKTPVGMALLAAKNDQLYGRYWGARKRYDSLHFNACYYRPIEWAIENGIRDYNPGAGGGHKIRRGFVSIPSYSLLKFYDPKLQNLMVHNIGRINRLEYEEIDALNRMVPFVR